MTAAAPAARPRRERTKNAAMRRAQMLEATLRSVARHGLASTTLATVSQESGLSQGVVVFYFENKQRLLAEALRSHYEAYRRTWKAHLEEADADPVARLAALMRADFDPAIFNPEALAIWHGFWGQASARPIYAEIADSFDSERAGVLAEVCDELVGPGGGDPRSLAGGIDALTDGLWLRAYLAPEWPPAGAALATTARFLRALFPDHAERIAAALGTDPTPPG